jgi:hypothetical protein
MPTPTGRTESSDKPPTARSSWFSTAVQGTLGTTLVAVLLGAAALPWWLSHPERLSRIIAKAAPELQGTVTFDRVWLGWFGPMVFEGMKIEPREAAGDPPISATRIEASHGLLALLFSAGDLGRIAVDGMQVDLVYDEAHRSNLETMFPPPGTEPGGPTTGPRQTPIRLRLDVEDAVVRITAPWTTETWVSDPISVRAALGPVAEGWSEWSIEPTQLVTHAKMEPAVAWGVLAYAAPVLADTTRASGRFSLRLNGARLPVGDPRAGTLSGVLAMHEVVVGPGPLALNLIESLPIQLPAPPAIRVADESHVNFRLADRRVWHEGLEFGLPLPGEGRRLDVQSAGSVGLDDESLDVKLVLPIPADLRQDRPLLAALAGKTISVGVAGHLGDPQVVFDGSIRQAAGQVAVDLIDRVRNGPSAVVPVPAGPPPAQRVPNPFPGPGAAASPVPPPAPNAPGDGQPSVAGAPDASTTDAIVDIVGGVLDEVARRRAEREASGEPPPPRRGRLRQWLQQRPGIPAQGPTPEPPLIPVQPSPSASRPSVPPPPVPQPPTR